MKPHVKLGKLFGVAVGLHFSWFIIALLIALSLSERFHAQNADWGPILIWATSLVTAALFFAALLAHELAHALMARRFGIGTDSITLFALGGVARIGGEPTTAKTEFWVALIGPMASVGIGGMALGLAGALGWTMEATPTTPVLAMLVWLGFINLALAIFNLVPGYPLDGGRVLRAIIWWIGGNQDRSMVVATRVGQAVGVGFIVLGVYRAVTSEGIGGLWISAIGWFLVQAAAASHLNAAFTSGLRGIAVKDLMTRDFGRVDGRTNLKIFVEEFLVKTELPFFLVEENDRVTGVMSAAEVNGIERNKWPFTVIDEVLRRLEDLRLIGAATPALEALETMTREGTGQLAVGDRPGQLEGVISRSQILDYVRERAGLKR